MAMYTNTITRKIFQTGKYSYIITLPKDIIKHLGWQRGEIVEVKLENSKKQLCIKKFKF
jgi:bifunctional DNA-binding transcriptional regulator/antitoxin component of YhaV-PrlF toxin-antitoxin module